MERNRGFTLIELIVTMVVAGILFAMVVPSFMSSIKNNTTATEANDLVSILGYARSEAVTQDVKVSICPSTDNLTCSSNWALGAIVYCQASSTTTKACTPSGTSTATLRTMNPLPKGYTLSVSSNATAITSVAFNPDGTSAQSNTTLFTLCDAQAEVTYAAEVQMLPSGRAEASPKHGFDFADNALSCP
jgi:type IV fimbrial biogenesis protein FimT